ncbi:interleukin-27 subunit beta isoform X1 [Anguilla rostrata]|uniref:interleukin-27 subunit beta isoform X1 n=2 Tax=Anguilla rostrata TaxID=7938 RepID=UPI0030D00099
MCVLLRSWAYRMCVRCTVRVCAVAILLCPLLSSDPRLSVKENQYTMDLYVAVGSAVNIPCKGEGGEGAQWRLNGMAFNPGPVLSIRNASLEDRGNYTCHSRNGSLLQTLFLQPGYPPSLLKVKCSSPGYPITATCSWSEEPEPMLPTRYTATYGISHKSRFHPCRPVPSLRHHCVLNISLFQSDPQVINVTATNPLGSRSTFFSFIVENAVKPDPPVNVTVTQRLARQLYVQWAPPPSWTDPTNFPLMYKVQYYHGDIRSARELGPYKCQSMVLKALRPGATYVVQVSAQDQLVGQRSDWSEPVSATVLPR